MDTITVVRQVSRVGNSNVIMLPARYAGRALRILMTNDTGAAEFESRAVAFGNGCYVVIPAPLAERFPPHTVAIVHVMEVEKNAR